MSTIASRDLRNHTAEVLRQVAAGTRVTVTVNGRPVAEVGPVRSSRKQFFAKNEVLDIVTRHQADAGLRDDLMRLAGDTTDELE
jgi:prevent-host-death family protein